jgi:transcriptional antiterminator NusG
MIKMVMNDDTWYVVRNTRGCTGFVGPASKPVPLTPEEVEKMGVEKQAALTVDFNVGDTVQITSGPLEGFMGKVEEINTESFKVKLSVNMFGRETPAEVDVTQVELL